jgi:hypothetical protein
VSLEGRCRQILNVRAVVLSSDGTRDKIGFEWLLSNCMSSTAASREILLVRSCACLTSILRAKRRWLCPATATRLELRRPELCPLRHATPGQDLHALRAQQQSRSVRKCLTFDGREHDGSFAMLVALTTAETVHQASHRRRPIGPRAALGQPVRAPQQANQVAMIEIALDRTSSRPVACLVKGRREQTDISRGWRDKSADVRRADMAGGEGEVGPPIKSRADVFFETPSKSIVPAPSAFSSP